MITTNPSMRTLTCGDTPCPAETSHCLEDMVAAREEGRERKKDIMEVKAGKKRKKEVLCCNRGEVAWGEAGSADNGKRRRKFLFEHPEEGSLEPGQVRSIRRLKQKLIVPLTETEVMARQLLVELARKVEEENGWTVELEDTEACEDLLHNVEAFEKASRVEKANQMKYAFQLGQRESEERKEKAARRSTDVEMRSVELCVQGTKRSL